MTRELDAPELIRRLDFAVFGLRGDNGLVSDIKGLRADFEKYVREEQKRREEEAEERDRRNKTALLTMIAAFVSLLGVVAVLIIAISTSQGGDQPPPQLVLPSQVHQGGR